MSETLKYTPIVYVAGDGVIFSDKGIKIDCVDSNGKTIVPEIPE